MRRIPLYWRMVILVVTVLVLLNLIFLSQTVCDFYADHIFGWWSESLGRLTGSASFSVGELMIYLSIAAVVFGLILLILLLPLHRKKPYRKLFGGYCKALLAWVLLLATLITLNLTPLYRTTHMQEDDRSYTIEELKDLRNYIVTQCNELAQEVERDETGAVVAPEGMTHEEVTGQVQELLRELSSEYPRLAGFYPQAKTLRCSDIMYFINTIGVYFPFSMEANMSAYVNDTWYPYTVAHELSHLKGYIYEDEANFIAYAACMQSEEVYYRYSAYLNVLYYVQTDYYNSDPNCADRDDYVAISYQVAYDCTCYSEETIEAMTKKEEAIADLPVNSDTIEGISESMTDTYLTLYDSEANYSEVTGLLLDYYSSRGY